MRVHLVWVPGYHSFPKWAIGWWLRKLLDGLKTLQLIFWDFNCHLNICCLRVNITLIFMSSSSNELIHAFVVKLYGISIQSFINLSKTLSWTSRIWNIKDLLKQFYLLSIHFPDSRLSVLNGLDFYFWWHDSENREFHVRGNTFWSSITLYWTCVLCLDCQHLDLIAWIGSSLICTWAPADICKL